MTTKRGHDCSATRRLSVVIPVYNEKDRWKDLLLRVVEVPLQGYSKEIVLVEDGSTDGTREQLKEFAADHEHDPPDADPRIRVVLHDRNKGKGAALRTGFQNVTGGVVIIQDADLEYDPNDYGSVLAPFDNPKVQVVYGSRFLESRSRKGYLANYMANRFLTGLSNLTTGQSLTDMETCYKAFRRPVIDSLNLEEDRFGFEPEVTAKVSKLGVTIHEVPISYNARTREEGKKIGFKDGMEAIRCIFRYAFQSRKRAVLPEAERLPKP